ncbi:MAG TPA: hypothetical protein VKZ96_09190 [Thermomicrobiales bacterium]|nr:hypothetical protein [Thermomicrobiales bacterium]
MLDTGLAAAAREEECREKVAERDADPDRFELDLKLDDGFPA